MTGYFNRFLSIDLSAGLVETVSLPPELLSDYLGGSALGARLFADSPGPRVPPLAPESPLYIMAGPMVGTTWPGSSRFAVCGRSPLTGIWGESTSGGAFGAQLKRAGFDGVWLTGQADRPVYIHIEDTRAAIEDAAGLWGKDAYDTIDALKEKYQGQGRVRVMAIGPAGENLVKYASIVNDKAHHFGRTGLGASLGAKKVKALVVRGSGRVPLADEEAYKQARAQALADIKESMICGSFHDLGTNAAMDLGMMTGDVPIKNWALGEAEEVLTGLGGPAMDETIIRGRAYCFACPIGCKPVVEVTTPGLEVPKGPGPEYETCGSFGSMIMNGNLEAVAKVNSLCNRFGLDTITAGGTVAFIMEAFEKGRLTGNDADGLDMTWGNMDAVLALIEKIAARQGFGDRAAQGSAALARELGPEADDYLVAVKKLELPMHDPRAFHGQGLAYMMSNRGGCHLQHSDQALEQGMVSWPELGLEEDYEAQASEGKARLVMISENIGQTANALCVCHFVHWAQGNENLLAGFNAVTGQGLSLDELAEKGRRAWVLKRALNNLMGITAEDDRLPRRVLTALTEGGAEDSVPDESLMKREYYEIRGLDPQGRPTAELLGPLVWIS